jgi:polyisoprenoid-binding protein YceI
LTRHAALACAIVLSAFVSLPAAASPAKFTADSDHMSVGFLVMHIDYARVLGMFREASGSFVFDEQTGALSDLRLVVKTDSVYTNHKKRDDHLKGADFLNVREFPEMVFVGEKAESTGERSWRLLGKLTLLGATRPLALDVTLNKTGVYPFATGGPLSKPNYVGGFSVRGTLKRSEFGMTYAVDNGWVGDQVDLIIGLEAIRG